MATGVLDAKWARQEAVDAELLQYQVCVHILDIIIIFLSLSFQIQPFVVVAAAQVLSQK